MERQKASKQQPTPPANDTNNTPKLSLDWWAVFFALALVALVVAGLPVAW